MYAEIIDRGHLIATHEMFRDEENQLRVQGKLAVHWLYEVARDCKEIDEVRFCGDETYVAYGIDRTYDPPRVGLLGLGVLESKQDQKEATNE